MSLTDENFRHIKHLISTNKEFEKIGILKSVKFGRNKYFVNTELFNLLKEEVNS